MYVNKIMTIVASSLILASAAATAIPSGETNDAAARIEWWRDAKFGLFIHWGLYAIPARGEWALWNEQIPLNEYAKYADEFVPENFTPASWAELAKEAGTKYMVLTARHHDGFALFDDGTNTYTSVKSAAQRDFVAEYVKAAREANLRVGLYYSPLDWRFPGYIMPGIQRESAEAMREQYHRQMKVLLSNYGKLDVLWFDGGNDGWLSFGGEWHRAKWRKREKGRPRKDDFSWRSKEVYAELRRLQPDVVINNRIDAPSDFHTRENWEDIGDFDNKQPWELCVTIAGSHWGYRLNQKVRPLKDYIQLLANVAGRGGNLLLNVGPDRNGQVDPAQAERLREIGAWLAKYGESIYATRGGPFLPNEWGVSTHHDRTIYLHILNWTGEKFVLPAIPAKIVKATALTGGTATFVQSADQIDVFLPEADRAEMNTIIALELDSQANAIEPLK